MTRVALIPAIAACSRSRPPPARCPVCSETGVIGAAAGVMGSLAALEVLKEIAGIGEGLAGRLLIYEALSARFRTVILRSGPGLSAVRTRRI